MQTILCLLNGIALYLHDVAHLIPLWHVLSHVFSKWNILILIKTVVKAEDKVDPEY